MADSIGDVSFTERLTLHVRVRRLVDSTGAVAIDIGKIEADIATADVILDQAGIDIVADSIEDWVSDDYFRIDDADEFHDLEDVHWEYGQSWINVYYVEEWDTAAGQCSFPNPAESHAIGLEDVESQSDEWRGIALAHEIGHYLGLRHPKAPDECPDTDSDTATLDPGNLMNQAADGRTDVVADIHLTDCQVSKARYTCYSDRADLIAPLLVAALA